MSILDSIQNFQEYGNNPKKGYMDNVFLDIVQQKKRLDKPLTQEEQEFLDNHRNSDDDEINYDILKKQEKCQHLISSK